MRGFHHEIDGGVIYHYLIRSTAPQSENEAEAGSESDCAGDSGVDRDGE